MRLIQKRTARMFRKIKENKWILSIILIFLITKLLFLIKFHSAIWDESVYIGMGKYIWSLGNAGLWEIIRPIGLPILLGGAWKLGLNAVIFGEILADLFAVGNIVMIYLICKKIFNKNIGLIAAIIAAITPIFYLYSSYLLTSIPAVFFSLLAIYMFLNNRFVLSGVFSAAALYFRFTQGIVLAALLIALIFKYNLKRKKEIVKLIKNSVVIAGSFIAVLAPYLALNYFIYRNETGKIYHALFRPWIMSIVHQSNPANAVNGLFENLFYYILQMNQNILLYFVFAGLVCLLAIEHYRKKLKQNSVILVILILTFTYLTYIINKQERFFIELLPYISILAGAGIFGIYSFIEGNKKIKAMKDYIKLIFAVFLALIVLSSAVTDYGYYNWRFDKETQIIDDFYGFFNGKEIKGPILISDPVFSAYSDAKFIPIYYSFELAEKMFEDYKDKAYAMAYVPSAFYCGNDVNCENKKDSLFQRINEKYNIAFEKEYYRQEYYIFIRKSMK